MKAVNEVEIIGRTANSDVPYQDSGQGRKDEPVSKKIILSLCEAAGIADRSVEELKRAIRAGELHAERRGWWRITAAT